MAHLWDDPPAAWRGWCPQKAARGLGGRPRGGVALWSSLVPLYKGLYIYYTTKITFVVYNFLRGCSSSSDLPLLQNFLHRPHIFLFDLLARDFGVALARGDLAMSQEVPDRDDLGPMFEEVRGKGMPQTMATRGDPGGFGVALHLLLDRFHRQGLLRAFAVPKDIALRSGARMMLQALLDTRHRIGGHIHASILAPFALDHAEGLLLPIDVFQF